VKPPLFDYRDPTTLDEALDILADAERDVTVLAGGQSLLPLLNMRLARPDVVVDVNRVQGLDEITITDDAVTIGATVRLSTVERDTRLREVLPVLPEAAAFVAHPQIRNRTTIGGTLCHADPAAELPAVAVALDARLHLRSWEGGRTVPAAEFFQSMFLTAKRPDELLVAVEFPRHAGFTVVYDEVSRRHGDFPFAGLCLGVRVADGVVAEARAAAAGVAERPLRLTGLETALVGGPLGSTVDAAVAAASAEVDPPTDHHGTGAFRRGLLRTLVRTLANRLEEVTA
jgi:carbon-monoxide dehydrogenase medium subunit